MVNLVRDIVSYLESIAPSAYQESYDNARLLTGDPADEVKGILCTLDVTEDVVQEAVDKDCNMIVAHHPIIFKGLKSLTGKNYVERTIIKAIRENIAIYAIHTNLDHVHNGVNRKISEKIALSQPKVLAPKKGLLMKLVTFIPKDHAGKVLEALYKVGAGSIGEYSNCSFQLLGEGTFLPSKQANPTIGEKGKTETVHEKRVELMLPAHLQHQVLRALRKAHPYEEVAYYLQPIENEHQEVGAGMIGSLENEMSEVEFLKHLKQSMELEVIKHTRLRNRPIKKVAICGGAGIFLLGEAKKAGADIFITSDVKYHEFFDADNQLVLADIGHYESEIHTKDLLMELLSQNFSNIALYLTKVITNPITYI